MNAAEPVEPPGLAEALLRFFVPTGVVGDSIVGDAREELAEYARRGGTAPRVWYWLHACRLVAGYVITRGGEAEMGTILKDLKFGARALARMPGSALISVVVLAIGIGLCSSMFSIVYGLYFRGMPVPEGDRIMVVFETLVERNQLQRSMPIRDLVDFRERQTSFEALAAAREGTVNLAGPDGPVRFAGSFVTANMFEVLRVQPILGRSFVEKDDAPGAPPNVILGYQAWTDRYGRDRSIVGQEVRVNGVPATILGVMPEGFQFPSNNELWLPLRQDVLAARRAQTYVQVYGRLRDGVGRDIAEQDVASIARQIEQENPESNEGIGARVDTIVGANLDATLNLVFGSMMVAVLCVLLVACANVANLLLARAAMRTKEAGVRVALGASRLRVMLPFFAEAFVLAAVGALVGIAITYGCVAWFDDMTAPARTGRPWFMVFEVDLPILVFIVGITGLTALVAGMAPAIQMSRTDVSTVLKDEARGSSGLHVGRISRILVTAEVALSCALLIGAGLMTKSIVNLGHVEHAYDTEQVFTARLELFETDYPDRQARQQLWSDLLEQLRASPRIADATLASTLPFQTGGTIPVAIDGVAYDDPDQLPGVNRATVGTGFFDTFQAELLAGREFTEADDLDSEPVAIVNQPMVERYFGGVSPVGRRFREGASDTLALITIVGVAPDMQMDGSQPPGSPDFEPAGYYVPLRQRDETFLTIVAYPRGGTALSITGAVRDAVRALDPDLPIYDVYSEEQVIERSTWFYGVFGTVFIAFGLAALFMASVGLYGVLSFAVTRRTQEMGIRMALGADARTVVGLVARQGAAQLGIGVLIGLGLASGLTRLVGTLLFDVDPQDPVVFGSVLAVIALVGIAAAVVPALRATSVSPVEALRAE